MAAIDTYAVTSSTAKALRALNKYGMNLADFAALTTNSSFDAFGNGTGYTVANWISDGVFANLAAVQAVYPICQSTSDTVDWVLLQSAADFMIYGSLGTSNYKTTKRTLFIPAGRFAINRALHLGYNRVGTPPADLNGNGYTSITIEGEGPNTDITGNGMTGTSITTSVYTHPGIVIHGGQQVILRGFTISGPYDTWMASNSPFRASNNWDSAAWRPAGVADANWIGGAAVNIGVGIDLYTNATSAAAYPARPLPAAFGGGTTTAQFGSVGGTDVLCEDVNIKGFFIGYGHPHGDNNAEFIRFNRGKIANCTYSFVIGHSQCRNVQVANCDMAGFYTAITSRGGVTGNANMHGAYHNIHFGQGFQLFNHPNGDWSGPFTLRDCYAESFSRIGTWTSRATLDGCYLSFIEQEGTDGVPYNHFATWYLTLDNCQVSGLRHGLVGATDNNEQSRVEIVNGTSIRTGDSKVWDGHTNEAQIDQGIAYISGLLQKPGTTSRVLRSNDSITEGGRGNNLNFSGDVRSAETFLDQEYTTFYSQHPYGDFPFAAGSNEMQGSVQQFNVPKITKFNYAVNINSRSGFVLTCDRSAVGDIKTDVGDILAFRPGGVDDALRVWTWFIVSSASGSTMTLHQLSNFNSTTATDYSTNGFYQIAAGSGQLAQYICTRIRQHVKLWVGDVTSGSAVITNVKHAFKYGAGDDFITDNFRMEVGDYHLHHEIERANTGGSGLKVHNRVSAIDFTANTITLTETFNITRTNYPLVFYVETFNA